MVRGASPSTGLALVVLLCSAVSQAVEPQPFPAGVYTFELTPAETPADVPADIRPFMTGKYVVTFTGEGRVRNVVSGKLDAEGRYASTPGLLVITDEAGPGHCQKASATGIYRWRLEGDKLKLEAVEDLCKWRRFAITLKTWTKVK
jgi:hypothetical protein